MLVLEGFIESFCENLVENVRFGRFQFSVFAKVSWKTVLEGFIFSFCENLVANARFGSVDSHFLRSFWKCGFSLFANVSWILTFLRKSRGQRSLEKCGLTFCEILVESARFGRLHCHFL